MNADKGPTEDPFVTEIRRQAKRARDSRKGTFWRGLASVGAIGWMISLPAVFGAMIGRWLDVRFESGVFWTLSLLVGGVLLGSASAWRHIDQELHD